MSNPGADSPKCVAISGHVEETLVNLCRRAREELIVCSPYVGLYGSDRLLAALRQVAPVPPRLLCLTDLSPANVCQGATQPEAVQKLGAASPANRVVHIPRLHAKTYIADGRRAIITSANLTRGGLAWNREMGVQVFEMDVVTQVRAEILSYAELGVALSADELVAYTQTAKLVRRTYLDQVASARAKAIKEYRAAVRAAEDELVRHRLRDGPMHTVFAKTLLHLLRRHGPLGTTALHPLIQAIHPELCDDRIDRIIEGRRYGKKWKHAVRTAQQDLKRRGLVRLIHGRWQVTAGLP